MCKMWRDKGYTKMNYFLNIIKNITLIVMIAICIKAIMGVHFPWEKCGCCGKKYGDHIKK